MRNQNNPPNDNSPFGKIHPLVQYIIGADILSLIMVVLGLFIPVINTIGASLVCMGGTITTSTTQNMPPGVISCAQDGVTEEITYIAMAFTFVFFSLVFGAISSIYYVANQKKLP